MTLLETLSADPFVIRRLSEFMDSQAKGETFAPPIRTPAQLVGEQRVYALGLVAGVFGSVTRDPSSLAMSLLAAVPVLWLNRVQQVAFSYNLPRHITGNWNLAHPVMYWSFEGALPNIDIDTKQDTGALTDAWLLIDHGTGLEIIRFGQDARKPRISASRIVAGMRYPEDVAPIDRQALQCIAFLNSPFVGLSKTWSAKANRKTRSHGRKLLDRVSMSVVELRSDIHEAIAVERGEGPTWKNRWLVRGHYRAQWYPASKSHRVIWIAPYLKGPAGADVKTPVYAVVR